MTVSISNLYNLRTSNFKANDVADAIDAGLTVELGGTTGGTSTAYTATPTPAWTSYASKDRIVVVPHTNNTGATTINVSSMGIKTVQFMGKALVGGELVSGVPAWLYYDGTNFQLANHGGGYATWTPTVTGPGSVSGTSILLARFRRYGTKVEIDLSFSTTLSGTLGTMVNATLPSGLTPSASGTSYFIPGVYFQSGGTTGAALGQLDDAATTVKVQRYDRSNYANLASIFQVYGYYVTAA